MKGLVLLKPNEFEVRELPVPELKHGEVLVRVKGCSICGTDIRILEGKKTKGVRYPSVIGHEIAGVIERTRGNVGDLKEGERVGIFPVLSCQTCRYCLEGMENLCQNCRAIGYEFDGGFAEYLRVPAEAVQYGHVFKLPDGMSIEEGALLEPLSCCFNGIRKAKLRVSDTCLIVGAGPIGLMHIQLARTVGVAKIIVSEPNAMRLGLAKQLGADICVDPTKEDLIKIVNKSTGGLGVDTIIMAIGVPGIVNELLKVIRKGGTLNLFAGFPDAGTCTLEANIIHYNEITVNGTSASTRLDYLRSASLVAQGFVRLKELVTHRFPLEQFKEAYALAKEGRGIKILIEP
ncbi:MAG: zinc-dependent dehydrogenase [Spirochaetes bacterium]|nr:zinc-dependent dehydrogenase [Spirochaetota bacterium]